MALCGTNQLGMPKHRKGQPRGSSKRLKKPPLSIIASSSNRERLDDGQVKGMDSLSMLLLSMPTSASSDASFTSELFK
jgi:hypothetical protein